MKSRAELQWLTLQIYDCIAAGDPDRAVQFLDDLHSEGMKEGGDIAETVLEKEKYAYQYALNVSCKPRLAILEAIKNKPTL